MFNKESIKCTKEDRFYYYDVDNEGYIGNIRSKKLGVIYNDIVKRLKNEHNEVYKLLDYFKIDMSLSVHDLFSDSWESLICFYNKGDNEGFYFHIGTMYMSKYRQLMIGKTLYEDRETANKINNILCNILGV